MPADEPGVARPGRRAGRLSRSAEFDRAYKQGRSVANRFLVIYTFARGEPEGPARLGLSVGRRVGGAVERNKVKRLLREAVGVGRESLPEGHDVVLVARPDMRELADTRGLEGVREAVVDLLARSSA